MASEKESILHIVEKQRECEFSLRFVVQNDKDQWKNCFTLLKLVKKGARREIEYNYGKHVVTEKLLSIKDGIEFLDPLFRENGNNQFAIPNFGEFKVTKNEKLKFLPSKQKYGLLFDNWPMLFCSFNVTEDKKALSGDAELLKEGLPYYPDVSDAIINFFELPVNFFNSYGSVYVVINDYRARIESLKLIFSKVQTKLDLPEVEHKNLVVKAFAQSGSKIVTLEDIYPKTDAVEFDIGFNPEKLHVALLSREDNSKIDGKEYGTWRSEEGIIIERPEEEIIFLARAGESQNLEYKGDIVSEENKNDFIESVVAFSNTSNGIILIGVADDGQILGSGKNLDDLRRMIHDSCDPPPQNVKIEEKIVSGSRVIVVDVPKGDDPPYQSKRDKNWYIRHNANDMRMERSELIRLLEERSKTNAFPSSRW